MGFFDGIGGAIAGAWLSNRQAQQNAAEAHDWSVEDADTNRAWQERMSNTAHQREVADLRAAGLNPILSATGGAGAPVGGGAMADSSAAPVSDYGSAISSGAEMSKKQAEKDLMKVQEQVQSSAVDVNRAQAMLLKSQTDKTNKEAAILGPKSFIMDKVEDAIKAVPKMFDKLNDKKRPYFPDPKKQDKFNRFLQDDDRSNLP